MELKPFYRLADFTIVHQHPQGNNYTAVCPACGKPHLSINKKSGLFHCFTPECNFNGICEEFRLVRSDLVRSEELGVRSYSPDTPNSSRSITNNSSLLTPHSSLLTPH